MIKDRIISVHIHKTAGSTFHQILSRQVPPEQIVFANLEGPDKALSRLSTLPEPELSKIKIIHGHFPFGWHETLKGDFKYIAIVRDPQKRILSDFTSNKTNPKTRHHSLAKDASLSEYLSNQSLLLNDNGIARFMSGDFTTPFGALDSSILEKALSNYHQYFRVVGLTERFDESMLMLSYALGFKNVFYKKTNISKSLPMKLTDEEKRQLKELTIYDQQIYDLVKANFEKEIKNIPLLKLKLWFLGLQNFMYVKIYLRFLLPVKVKIKGA